MTRTKANGGVRWALALALLALASPAPAQQVVPPAVQSHKLKNGLRVLLAPDTLSSAVDVSLWYRAGTRYEPAGMSGITHLMERWAYRGSPRRGPGEHRRLVQAEGGVTSTFTTSDASCFFNTVPAEALELALKLEAERMGTVTLTAEGLERERRIAREEHLQLARGGPIALGLKRLFATAFPGHPYGWPATGREQDLDKVTLAACEAYQKSQYAPDNAVLVVAGRFDAAPALSLVRRHFGSIPFAPLPAAKPPALAPQLAEQRASERIEGEVAVMLVGWRAAGGGDRSTESLEVLSRLLGAGPRSRLGRELMRAPARCLAVESGFDARRDGSLLYVAAVLRPGADSAAVELALHAECERFAASGPEAPELDAAKRELEMALMLDWEAVRGRGQSLGRAEAVFGDHQVVAERLRRLRELTPADLARAATEALRAEKRTMVWLVPAGAPAGARGGGMR